MAMLEIRYIHLSTLPQIFDTRSSYPTALVKMKTFYFLALILSTLALSAQAYWFCGCKPEGRPLCANNGKTYDGLCEFRCDAAHTHTPLYVVHGGPCEAPIPLY